VFATEPLLEEYVRVFPNVAGIGTVITNGFDEEDFEGLPAVRPQSKGKAGEHSPVTITHVGSFAGMRSPRPMAEAVRDAATRTKRRLEARFVGDGVIEAEPMLRGVLGDSADLQVLPWQPHHSAIAEMQSASILWLDAMVHFRPAATGKIYEYLRTGNPILALAHDQSPAAALIRSFDAGQVVSSNDPATIGPVLAGMVSNLSTSRPSDRSLLQPYDRRVLAERMSVLLASVGGRG
jgi:hypothetical protein